MRELPRVLLATDSFECQVEITGQPPKDLVMLAVPLGEQPTGILGRGRTLTSDRVDLIEANTECDWIVPPGTSMSQAYVPREAIRSAYRRLYWDDLPDDLNGLQPAPSERRLISPLRSLTSAGLFGPEMATHDQNELSQRLMDLTAMVIACRARNAPKRESIRYARRREIYSKAREYIDGNLGSSMSISDICHHVGVSISTLERAFLRTTGLTPLAYVQSRRMNKARHLLLTDGSEMSVTQAALLCGLTHLGRFSQSYRSFFGELPSQTAG
jgi:AraC-like DNA-binding protein